MSLIAKTLSAILTSCAAMAAVPAVAQDAPATATVRPAGYKPRTGDATVGAKLFSDKRLSTNGMSCASCHANNAAFANTFVQPYPHKVAMANDQLGLKTIHLDEMVQACLVMPMEAKPLPWNSKELADLTAYMAKVQKTFKPAQ